MNDSYVEYSVRSKAEPNFYIGIGLGIVSILLGLFILLYDLSGIILFVIGIALIVVFLQMKNVEYEYIITNGDVEISAIYGASRRKVKKQFDASTVKYICAGNSNRIAGENIVKKYDYTSKRKDEPNVAVIIEKDEKKELVLMELNEKCVNHMKTYLRNKVYEL